MDPSRANQSRAHHVSPSCANHLARLVLIDGNAILHRAFHALPPLTDPDGHVVNAVYGFTTMLIRIINDLKPTNIAVCFDRPKPTFRKKLYEGYQAKRPEMDESLVPQIQMVHELLEAFHIPMYEMDGFEADDVIGTLVKRVSDEHLIKEPRDKHVMSCAHHVPPSRVHHVSSSCAHPVDQVTIVTGDKDLLQLVDSNTNVYMPTKGLSEAKLYGKKETKEKMGVDPVQIPDFKALAGDQSDNYPGIEGIGPKTAVMLLEKTKSIDRLYQQLKTGDHLGLSDTLLTKLTEGEESARLSHQLATIKTDVPIAFHLKDTKLPEIPSKEAITFLEKLNFKSLVKRLQGGPSTSLRVNKGTKEQSDKATKEQGKKANNKNNSNQLSLV